MFSVGKIVVPINRCAKRRKCRVIVMITNAEHGEHVAGVSCCGATGVYVLPMIIFEGLMIPESKKQI